MRIASLNALSDPEYRSERVTQMFVEARDGDVDVLCLQEVPHELHAEITTIARAHGFGWQQLATGVPGDTVGTFSRLPIEASGSLSVEHPDGVPADAPVGPPRRSRKFSWVRVRGVLIFNVHLTWGAHNEPARLREVAAIERFAADAESGDVETAGVATPAVTTTHGESSGEGVPTVTMLVGDFNAEPDNDCVRYLRGKTPIDGVGTYWTEATLGTDLQHAATTRETNQWGMQSARSRGVDARLLPSRRIDYVFSRGWRHGGPGTMRDTRRFGTSVTPEGIDLSDHFGWVTDVEEVGDAPS